LYTTRLIMTDQLTKKRKQTAAYCQQWVRYKVQTSLKVVKEYLTQDTNMLKLNVSILYCVYLVQAQFTYLDYSLEQLFKVHMITPKQIIAIIYLL
jgi:hypothetical protein